MPAFIYQAAKITGETISGEKIAASKEDVVDFLHKQELMVIKVEEKLNLSWNRFSNLQIGDVPISEKVVITRQLATMLGAGLPVTQAIEVLIQQQSKYPKLKKKLGEVYKDEFRAGFYLFNRLISNGFSSHLRSLIVSLNILATLKHNVLLSGVWLASAAI